MKTDYFPELLEKLIQNSDYTFGQIATRSGVPKTTVINWVKGRVKKPRVLMDLLRVAMAINLTESETSKLLQSVGYPSIPELKTSTNNEEVLGILSYLPSYSQKLVQTPPFQAVADLPYFVGREKELEGLKKALLNGKHTVLYSLEGMGGVGKTALAAHTAYKVRSHFPDGVLWARLDTSDTMSILSGFASAYERDVNNFMDLSSRSQVVRGILANKQALIVLDNARNSEEVRPLLPPTGKCAVIITTRHRNLAVTAGAEHFVINPFSKEKHESLELFVKFLGRDKALENEKSLIKLANLLGHLPLAVAIAASRLAYEPGLDVIDFLDHVIQEKRRLQTLEYEDKSVRASFNLTYRSLTPELQSFFTSLCVFGGEDFSDVATKYVGQISSDEAQRNLTKLYGLSLIQIGRPNRYRFHPLLRDYAKENLPEESSYERMAEYFNEVLKTAKNFYESGGEKLWRGLELFDLEWSNIQSGFAWTTGNINGEKATKLCIEYPISAGFLLNLRQTPQERIHWCELALEAAHQLQDNNSKGKLLVILGTAHNALGNPNSAIKLFEKALAIARENGDQRTEFDALDNMGRAYKDSSHFEHSVECHQQALTIARKIGYRRGEGNAIGNLGVTYKNQGKLDLAIELQKQALNIAREMGDFYGEGTSLNDLGVAYFEDGNLEKSIIFYTLALDVARRIGDKRTEAAILGNLGLAHAGLKKHKDAIKLYEQALEIDYETGNRLGQEITLNGMGDAYSQLGMKEQAIELHQRALAIAQDISDSEGEAVALFDLSVLLKDDKEKLAKNYARRSLKIFEKIGSTYTAQVRKKLSDWNFEEE